MARKKILETYFGLASSPDHIGLLQCSRFMICEKRDVKLIVRVVKRISIEWISMVFYMTKQLKFVLSAFYNTLSPLIWDPCRICLPLSMG